MELASSVSLACVCVCYRAMKFVMNWELLPVR